MSCLVRLSYLILCLRDVYANVMNEKNILEVRNLCISAVKDGEQRTLVENISFSLEKGKVLGIVGESGSGKSITCYAITGLLNPNLRVSGGEVLFRHALVIGDGGEVHALVPFLQLGAVQGKAVIFRGGGGQIDLLHELDKGGI